MQYDDSLFSDSPAPAAQAAPQKMDDSLFSNEPAPREGKSLVGLGANAVKDAGQIASSGASLAGNMIAHPIDTTSQVVKGLPGAIGAWAKELGIPEALHGQFADAVHKFGNSAYEHPVSRALDVASIALPALKGAGFLGEGIKGAELADKAAELGNGISKAADARWARAAGGTIQNAQELTRELGPAKGAEEFQRLGRTARNEKVVTPWNGIADQAQKVAEMNAAAGKDVRDLRTASDIQGDAPRVSDLMNRIRGDVGPKYTPDISAETADFDRALNRVQKLQDVEKLQPGEELEGFMKEPPASTEESFEVGRQNPDFTAEPKTIHVPDLDQVTPGPGQMQFSPDELFAADPSESRLVPGSKEVPNPAFKSDIPTVTERATREVSPYEQFRRAQEDPNYIPEYDVYKPTTHTEIAKTATALNAEAATKTKLLQASGATTDVANALSRLNDASIMKALTPEQGARYQAALQRFGDSEKLESMVGQKAAYEAGASRNRISNNLINRFQQRFGYQLTAAGMDKLAAFLKTNPEKFGKYAGVLNHALVEGPAAFATTYHLIAQHDPQFAQELSAVGSQQ